jgi:molybdopterin/thiamine biosynthesis adenylyltransferase
VTRFRWSRALVARKHRRSTAGVAMPAASASPSSYTDQSFRPVEVRVPAVMFNDLRAHVEDRTLGEEAGFLLCCSARTADVETLVAREWVPVPQEEIVARDQDYVVSWTARFNSAMIARANESGAALVLVHSHGPTPHPGVAGGDLRNAKQLFPGISRLLPSRPSGTIVLGADVAAGQFWVDGHRAGELEVIKVVGAPTMRWPRPSGHAGVRFERARLDRQTRAIGARSDEQLRNATVAVVGLSGGGSHCCQQLAHMGVGTVIVVDSQIVEDANRGRMVGSIQGDVDTTLKTDVMTRMIKAIDPAITVVPVPYAFPDPAALSALKRADVIVGCVDRFGVRSDINTFCRRYHVPYVDVGVNITTEGGKLRRATGQVVAVTPDSPCARCTPLLSDAVLAKEQKERPVGYDLNPEAGDPQVISMNGTLSSEACNVVLDLITGYAGGSRTPGWWMYDGRVGTLVRCDLPPRRPGCPACAEQGAADPIPRP